MKSPTLIKVDRITSKQLSHYATMLSAGIFPKRCEVNYGLRHRVKCAWYVLTGRADILLWPDNSQ